MLVEFDGLVAGIAPGVVMTPRADERGARRPRRSSMSARRPRWSPTSAPAPARSRSRSRARRRARRCGRRTSIRTRSGWRGANAVAPGCRACARPARRPARPAAALARRDRREPALPPVGESCAPSRPGRASRPTAVFADGDGLALYRGCSTRPPSGSTPGGLLVVQLRGRMLAAGRGDLAARARVRGAGGVTRVGASTSARDADAAFGAAFSSRAGAARADRERAPRRRHRAVGREPATVDVRRRLRRGDEAADPRRGRARGGAALPRARERRVPARRSSRSARTRRSRTSPTRRI